MIVRRKSTHRFHWLLFFLLSIGSCKSKSPLPPETDHSSGPQSKVFITYDKISNGDNSFRVQDFDLDSKYLFIHPTGAYGLYKFSLRDSTLTELIRYGAGNYIAEDSGYVFYETSGYAIQRYNLAKGTTDLVFDLSSLEYTTINGMDVYQHDLYVMMLSQTTGDKFLAKFDLNGNLVETIPYPRNTLHLAIHNDVVYAIYYPDNKNVKLSRFDLRTKSFLADATLPTENWDGIRIVGGFLYFTDYRERAIKTIPISAIQ